MKIRYLHLLLSNVTVEISVKLWIWFFDDCLLTLTSSAKCLEISLNAISVELAV